MEVVRKDAPGATGSGLEFVLSDASVDRYGDIIEQDGWDLRSFRRNPIALFGHNASFPIGTWANLRVEGERLLGRLNLAARGTSARIDELIGLVEQGILRAVSVGFRPIEHEAIDEKKPHLGRRFRKSELVETSLVAVPANPAALALAKSMNVSDETLSIAFGEHAGVTRRNLTATGGHAERTTADRGNTRPLPKVPKMKTLSQRIEDAQAELNARRDRLVELSAADEPDIDAIEELNTQIDDSTRTLTTLKASEQRLAGMTLPVAPGAAPPATVPAQPRRPLGYGQKQLTGLDLLVRNIVVRGISEFGSGNPTIDQVLERVYPGHEATAIVCKADQTIGTTGTAGWAAELVQTQYADFVDALTGVSIYPQLRARGISVTFDGFGTLSIPSRTAGTAGGGFVAEGSPIRVGKLTTAAVTVTPFKMGVIVAFSRELAKRSTPTIEALVRQAILEDTAAVLDPIMLDATAASAARPAGLLNGVSAAAVGYGGGDYQAVIADFSALLAPFISANAVDNITVIMNPAQGLAISMMAGPGNTGFGWFSEVRNRVNIIESTHATAGRLIAIRNSDLVTGNGDNPEFDVSEQATIHMEDTTPLEIVSGTGPTTADPVRSLWQTASVGIRMIMDITWKMRRTGMVQWINGTSY